MSSRHYHAAAACIAFILVAAAYGLLTAAPVDLMRAAAWSAIGIATYIVFSRTFGFDPQRTRVAPCAAEWVHYVDRWELRLGQATLSMLGCTVLLAKLLDPNAFVLAVVSGTLSAWLYFLMRLFAGGYDTPRH